MDPRLTTVSANLEGPVLVILPMSACSRQRSSMPDPVLQGLGAKPVGCKQPTGPATVLTWRGAAAPRKRCGADSYMIARSFGELWPPAPRFFFRHDVDPMEGVTVALGRTGNRAANRTLKTCRKADI